METQTTPTWTLSLRNKANPDGAIWEREFPSRNACLTWYKRNEGRRGTIIDNAIEVGAAVEGDELAWYFDSSAGVN